MSLYQNSRLDSKNEPEHVNQLCILWPGAAILRADYLIFNYTVQMTDKSSINITHFKQSWFPFQCDGAGVSVVLHIIKLHTAQLKWSIASWRWSASGVHPTQFDAKEHGIAIRWSQDSLL